MYFLFIEVLNGGLLDLIVVFLFDFNRLLSLVVNVVNLLGSRLIRVFDLDMYVVMRGLGLLMGLEDDYDFFLVLLVVLSFLWLCIYLG